MTRTFNGKIVGNNLRRDFSDYEHPKQFDASTVEFQMKEPFINSLMQFEIEGRYPIGSTVLLELTVLEPQ